MTQITRSYPSALGYDGSAQLAVSARSNRAPLGEHQLRVAPTAAKEGSRSASIGGREMTRMGWTGRAPAPNGSESVLGAFQEKEHHHA